MRTFEANGSHFLLLIYECNVYVNKPSFGVHFVDYHGTFAFQQQLGTYVIPIDSKQYKI